MPGSDYSFGAKVLHRIVLNSSLITKASFNLEEEFFNRKASPLEDHVFITGLARSGTTSILQKLYDSGTFCSLTYQDMPFVLMPNLWKRVNFLNEKNFRHKERAHGDGIEIGIDSPEAFEEVFWRVYCSRDYIFPKFLGVHEVDEDDVAKFRQFINHVVRKNPGETRHRYLSKNNNTIVRLDSIAKYFPNAYFLVLYRDPLQQSISLLQLHRKFRQMHERNKFSAEYMDWLCHFEFGINHRPFRFDSAETNDEKSGYSYDDVNYWLHVWKEYYTYALKIRQKNIVFVCFEEYCYRTKEMQSYLSTLLSIDEFREDVRPFIPKVRSADDVEMDLLNECRRIYAGLCETYGIRSIA
jgi:hypothetical protein